MLGCLTNDQCKAAVGVFVALSTAKTFLFLLRLFFFLFNKCFTHSTLTTAFANFLSVRNVLDSKNHNITVHQISY